MELKEFYRQNKTYLVTGATGFIAQNLIDHLLEADKIYQSHSRIVAFARNGDKAGRLFKNIGGGGNFELVIGELDEIDRVAGTVDYIFHTACISNSRDIQKRPAEVIQANVLGTYHVLEYIRKYQKACKLIFFSSGAVYGNTNFASGDIGEHDFYALDPMDLANVYAESKKMGESMLYAYWRQYGIRGSVVRLGHIYGPKINLNDGHVYSDFVRDILNKDAITVRGTGRDRREFTYVTDAIDAIMRVTFLGENGEAYNVANEKCLISIGELAQRLSERFLDRKKAAVLGAVKTDIHKYADGTHSLKMDKIKKLGWNPQTDVEEGFEHTIQYFKEEV